MSNDWSISFLIALEHSSNSSTVETRNVYLWRGPLFVYHQQSDEKLDVKLLIWKISISLDKPCTSCTKISFSNDEKRSLFDNKTYLLQKSSPCFLFFVYRFYLLRFCLHFRLLFSYVSLRVSMMKWGLFSDQSLQKTWHILRLSSFPVPKWKPYFYLVLNSKTWMHCVFYCFDGFLMVFQSENRISQLTLLEKKMSHWSSFNGLMIHRLVICQSHTQDSRNSWLLDMTIEY